MRGMRFYEEMKNKRRRESAGTVVAVELVVDGRGRNPQWRWNGQDMECDAFGSVMDVPDGNVCGTGVSRGYLREKCIRISERRARVIHPRLFAYLDREV